MDVENPLIPVDVEICAQTHITEAGREYICILPRHPKKYSKRKGGGIYQHFMVVRYPYREYPETHIEELYFGDQKAEA